VENASHPITSDTFDGIGDRDPAFGKTYYFSSDITINANDTLLMQPGSKLLAIGDGLSYKTSPADHLQRNFYQPGNGRQQQLYHSAGQSA